jgi:type VI secretion system protein
MEARGLLSRMAHERGKAPEVRQSILAHLRKLLNTRCGEAPSAPMLGLPDFSDLAHSFPDALALLERSVQATIEAFEPRLRHVNVHHVPLGEGELRIRLEITGIAVDSKLTGPLAFSSTLVPGGQIDVR